ncbi:homeobox protein 2-like [Contarinia nasturtii]|uniref:homeobox protein 2-like n=1 Tax=Contarinia nasturtii TaxID=265458 RepID=UPI0012D487DE|nr:homeobox protein 2-like [Contarinia nasturtii]XP_031627641.1 homeobox protein 2-like [Contarinia nasturtii]
MKYPQLVSTRAVSAISDWLVTELEQLGVDASSVYSRLLLSLLHTPLQINALDLAEISDNKIGSFTRNKLFISKSGNSYRRFSAADTEALKRLAAIDSLLEAVPSDQQLSKIETLVDELSLKLREIEEQSSLDESDFEIGPNNDNALSNSNVVTADKKTESSEDPANRYFNAFPALSDQSKNAYCHKTTSWPQVDSNKHPHSDQSINQSNPTAGAISIIKKKTKRRRVANSTMMAPTLPNQPKPNGINSVRNARTVSSKTGHKKKPSDTMWDTDFDGAWEMGRDLIREFVLKQNNRNRSISESDAARFSSLENETVIENGTAVNENSVVTLSNAAKYCDGDKRCEQIDNDEENLMRVAAAATSSLFGKNFELNVYALNIPDTETTSSSSRFTSDSSSLIQNTNDRMLIRSEGYATPDTLGSWSEIETAGLPREPDHETTVNCNHGVETTGVDCVDSSCMETNYLAAFEAKFNHNMEALWNDCKQNELNIPPKTEPQLNHSFWLNYNHSNATAIAAAAATAAIAPTDTRATKLSTDQFKSFFQANQPNACPKISFSGADKNQFISAQPNSLNSNSSSTTGGMNLTTSIWSLDNPNNSDDIWVDNPNNNDISFYANARLWEWNQYQSKSLNRQMNLYATEPTENVYGKTNKITGAPSNFDGGNYENASFSKWSDNDTPYLPIQQDACTSPQKAKNNDKIRSNLFENSYFNNYQLTQLMNSSMNGRNMAQAETNIVEHSVNQTPNVVKRRVTLLNHSTRSCFKEVEPLSFEAKQELQSKTNARKYQSNSTETIEQEDLLTSERSRFRPIKQTYADGYTFDISNKLDQINYERSKSGMLYHDSEVYREYYVYDEEGNGGSRCDTSQSNADVEFTLKYCVRQNDKSCQTDDLSAPGKHQRIISPNVPMPLNVGPNRIKSFSSLSNANISSLQKHRSYFDSNDSKEMHYEDSNYMNDGSFDKLIEMSQDSWCLNETRQCCNNVNNAHALWEHCTSCSNDMVSMPANRLLKDELSADGDEIMSDLKCLIQSISFHSDWEEDDDEEPTLLAECDDGDVVLEETPIKTKMTDSNRHLLADMTKLTEYTDETNDELINTSNHIYSNVTKLISDLLQPEKAQTLVKAISEKCQQGRLHTDDKYLNTQDSCTKKRIIHETKDIKATKNDLSCNSSPLLSDSSNQHFGSLWAYNDNSIWRRELPNDTMGKHTGDDETGTMNRLGDDWEHANLEKIWKNIPSTNTTTVQDDHNIDKPQQSDMDKTIHSTITWNENKFEKQPTLDLNKHTTESQPNKLDKFMDLIRQQTNARAHENHTQKLNKNHINRYDRKRRHSATSQNYFDQLNYALNNCDAIECIKKLATNDYDGESIVSCKPNDESTATTIITCKYWTACDSFCVTSTLSFNNNNNNNNNSSNINNNIADDTENIFNCYHKHMQQQSKYHPEQITDSFNANEPPTNHPTTCGTFLVKQVAAMVSRPLTR